jgi:dihydropyrimidine dehydrogenase (NAD+) subunit PreA
VCRDNQVDCIDWVDGTINIGRVAKVDEDECIGCDLCSLVCPVVDCIRMEEQPRELAPMSWNQLSDSIGTPGYCPAESGMTWDEFPDAIDGKVDSHGMHNLGETIT